MTNQLTIIQDRSIDTANSAEQNPAVIYLASLGSPQSRRTMRAALDKIAKILTNDSAATAGDIPAPVWGTLRNSQTQLIRSALANEYKAATANKMLSALRGVLRAAYDLDQINDRDYRKAISLKPVKGDTSAKTGARGRALTAKEIGKLKAVCLADTTPAGVRDLALIAVAYTCGLRRSELVALDLADYHVIDGKDAIYVRSGKGNKDRNVYIENGQKEALERWIIERGTFDGPMFTRIGKGGKMTADRLSTQAVYFIFEKRAKDADIEKFAPHDMRRTFAGDSLDKGIDIATVADLMGHASVTTTAKYDRRGEKVKQEAATLLHF